MKRIVAVLTAVAAAAGFAGCKAQITKNVVFIADSVTAQSAEEITAAFNLTSQYSSAGRYAPNFASVVGGQGLRQVEDDPNQPAQDPHTLWPQHVQSIVAHTHPEVVVVELGYNDCHSDTSTYGDDVTMVMDNIPTDVPVHWLTMQDHDDSYSCEGDINAALQAATTRYPNLTLLPYADFMNPHPEWFNNPGPHLNATGQQKCATWLKEQLDAIYSSSTTTTAP